MEITVTDTLFLKTRYGLVRPSDVDGEEILCDDGEYRPCTMERKLMKDFWTLYPSNGMILELNDGSSIKSQEGKWISLEDVCVGCGLFHERVGYSATNLDLQLDLEDFTSHSTGLFEAMTPEFATLSAVYATTGKIYKNGDVGFKTRSNYFDEILRHFKLTFIRKEYDYRVKPSYITELLKECYGEVSTTGKGYHYIPDYILLEVNKSWVNTFIKEAMQCYGKIHICDNSYSSFGSATKYVNDFVHFVQQDTALYQMHHSFMSGDVQVGICLLNNVGCDAATPVSLVQGFKYGVGSVGYKVSVEGDHGIYMSGFYVK